MQQSAAGNNLYVAPNGSDTNDGSQGSPFATIQKAADSAIPGTIIHVASGIYTQKVVSRISGTATSRIMYISDVKWEAKIHPSGTDILWINNGDYVDIIGFDISGDASSRIGILNWASFDRIIGNHVHNIPVSPCTDSGGAGIVNGYNPTFLGHDDDVIGNVVHDIGTGTCRFVHGIYHQIHGGHICNNISYRNSGWGIQLWHAANANIIANNLIFENKNGGITIGNGDAPGGVIADGIIVTNNIIVHNYGTSAGLFEYTPNGNIGTNQYINNLVFGNTPVNVSLKNQTVGTISADPQFVNYQPDGSGDYHTKATSPAIDAGTTIAAPAYDIDGIPRPQGKGYDIGPYEFTATPLPTQYPPLP